MMLVLAVRTDPARVYQRALNYFTEAELAEPITKHPGRFLPSTRYRHPGDVIRLIGSGLVLTGMLAAVALAPNRLTGPGAATVTWLGSGHKPSAALDYWLSK